MADSTGAELLVEILEQYGVSHTFGNPGTTELPVVRALADSDIEYMLGLHEDVAVGMAAGYASTRRYHADDGDDVLPLGVANLHVTPGVAHGLGNLYNASVTGAPILVTAGNHSRDFRHEEPILSGDLRAMTDQFTKWSDEVLDVEALPTMIRRAVRVALTPPTGPVFLGLPLDVMLAETDATPDPLGGIPAPGPGDPSAIDRATERIAAGDQPVLIVGDQIARAGTDAVEGAVAFAEATGARVHGEILSSEINFPGAHDQWASFLPPSESVVRNLLDTDLIIYAGISTHTTLTAHEKPLQNLDATTITLGTDAWQLGKTLPADVSILGDPGAILTDLAQKVKPRVTDDERADRRARIREVKDRIRQKTKPGDSEDDRPSKHELVAAIRAAAPDAYLVDEGVTSKYVMLSEWPFEPQQYISNKGGGLGYGLSAALGASVAESQREDPRDVLGFVGDGSYLYYPNAMYTAARYGLDLTVVVSDNRNYRILKDNAADLFDESPEDTRLAGVDFDPPVDIPANARSHGAEADCIEVRSRIESAVREGIESDGPTVLDVLVHD
jgi:benzoylformate decarboxylase